MATSPTARLGSQLSGTVVLLPVPLVLPVDIKSWCTAPAAGYLCFAVLAPSLERPYLEIVSPRIVSLDSRPSAQACFSTVRPSALIIRNINIGLVLGRFLEDATAKSDAGAESNYGSFKTLALGKIQFELLGINVVVRELSTPKLKSLNRGSLIQVALTYLTT
ncbi:hypothetical protein LZL87_013787 [Fusarium oxysporum]|nr:hypothetical protein LZL87_013787 [Fusarium oxysporum]BDU14760.1 hypothetical protein g348 [Fusarium commune]